MICLIQKSSDTDKQINLALRQSPMLSYLLSFCSISTGVLSLFSIVTILGSKPALAHSSFQSASLPEPAVEEEPTSNTTNLANEEAPRTLGEEKTVHTAGEYYCTTITLCEQTVVDISLKRETTDSLSLKVIDEDVELTTNVSDNQLLETVIVPTHPSLAQLIRVNSPHQVQRTPFPPGTDFRQAHPVQVQPQQKTLVAVNPALPVYPLSASSASTTFETSNLQAQLPTVEEPTLVPSVPVTSPPSVAPRLDSVEGNVPLLTEADNVSTTSLPSFEAKTGAAALTGIKPVVVPSVAQGFGEDEAEPDSLPQISETYDPLSPSLDVQGVFLNQVDSSARLRLRGFYPVSPNALFGAIVDLATGNDFAGTEDSGFNLSELYFTGNLPDYPNLRLVVGLMDLTSYFDRNSFAKDNTTHFFNNAFQTNPALATAGIGSRLGVLLNWNITDNIEAKGAAFSSNRNLGDFALDAFAGEIGFRAGNGIIRATYSTDKDTGRDGIVGFPINQAPFFERGTQNGDREDAFGINGEYFIPELNLGLFARYGWHENRELDRGADTYSLGLNFLDLFMKEDRLGFGYGRNLSDEDVRRLRGDKVSDVWELFYDARISPNFRAGVTLQARDEFSDVILGFRVRTDWQIFP